MKKQTKLKTPWWNVTFKEAYLSAFEPLHSQEKTQSEVNWLMKILKLPKKSHILDIPCGAGRHSLALADLGYRVTGFDFSKVLLKEAAKKNVQGREFLYFKQGDMRQPRLKNKYEAILSLGNSFGYFNDIDNEKVISNFSKVLKRSGKLVLDLPNTAGMLRNIVTKQKIKIKSGHILIEQVAFNPLTLVVDLRWTIVQSGKKSVFQGTLRLYTFPEIKKMLERYNFKISKVYGSFQGAVYNIDTPRMIVLAQKIK